MAAAVHSAMSMDSPQPSRSPNLLPGEIALCQVDGCNADLSGHKEYYRRHRVCEMHAKAVQVTVGNETQRFCQQCSRFHMLDSFDEGKRSCRRRLLGHNRRRRKQSQNADSWPAIRTDGVQTPDSLRRLNSVHDAQQDSKRLRLSSGQGMGMGSPDSMTRITGNLDTMGPKGGDIPIGSFSTPAGLQQLTPGGRSGSNYGAAVPSLSPSELSLLLPQRPSGNPQIVNQAVQPVTSILLRQAAQLQTAPQAVVQDRTGRVSLKLFDRKPEDLPANLKEQVNEWLGKSPLLMENFVREGCTVVSFIMRLSSAEWTKVSANLQESLERLVCGSGAEFWGSGGILVQWETQMAFIREGKVQEVPVPLSRQPPMILSVKPFCVAAGKRALLTLSGFNLCPPDAQAVCYVGGKAHTSSPQKVQRTPSRSFGEHGGSDLEKGKEELNLGERAFREMEEVQIVMPVVEGLCGRVFVEVEHLIGPCSSNIWPVLVADKDVCNDIATLERFLDSDSSSTTGGPPETQIPSTVELLHDLGWALQELNQLKSELAAKEGEDLSANETVSPSRGECYHLPDPALEALIQLCISRGLWEITKRLLDLAVERRKLV